MRGNNVPRLREQALAAPPRRRVDLLTRHLQEAVAALGGLAAEDVDPERPFGELGLDSVTAVELVETTGRALGLELPPTLLFDHPTIEALATELAGRL